MKRSEIPANAVSWWNSFHLADRLEMCQIILDLPQKLITVPWLWAVGHPPLHISLKRVQVFAN